MTIKPVLKTVAEFHIDFLQFLDENSQVTQPLPEFATPEILLRLYKQMTLTRVLDKKAVNLQRIGKMGTYPSSLGQEAVSVGTGYALKKTDVLCPYYRDQGVLLQRGVKMSEILLSWAGDERGHAFTNDAEDFPLAIPIATQCLHAAGVAFAIKHRQEKRAVLTNIGEGGTSKGDFYEALNVAGAWTLPLVFVVNNNQWAISVARDQQTHCQTIAQKAIAGGIPGIQVDGNDIIAVVYAVTEALQKARAGLGPTLIECITYRLCDHTTADDASRYRPEADYQAAWEKEPIRRLGYYLENLSLWSKEQEQQLQTDCSDVVEKAVTVFLNTKPAAITDIIDYTFATLPDALLEQREIIRQKKNEKENG